MTLEQLDSWHYMALSIKFSFWFPASGLYAARETVSSLHRFSRALPILGCSNLVELDREAISDNLRGGEHSSLLSVAGQVIKRGNIWHRLWPTHICAFTVFPTCDSESVCLGLARYPDDLALVGGSDRELPWTWRAFCKTMQPTNLEVNDVQRLIISHLMTVRILDKAVRLGIRVAVEDETDFWTHRNVVTLATTIFPDHSSLRRMLDLMSSWNLPGADANGFGSEGEFS